MQYQTSPVGRFTKFQKILISVIALTALGLLFLSIQPETTKTTTIDDDFLNTYRDPITGEVVTDADNKTNELFGNDFPTPTLLGFSKLLTIGFTQDQIDALILALGNYSTVESFVPNEISLYPEPILFEEADPNGFDIDVVKLKLRIARAKDINAVITRNSLSTITVKLFSNDVEIYNLGPIDSDSFERS